MGIKPIVCTLGALLAVLACGWTSAQSQPSFKHLQGGLIEDVFFLDGLRGWCCGDGGVVQWTTDGGNTWTSATMPEEVVTQVQLNGLFVTDDGEGGVTGWAIGHDGVILRTVDGFAGTIWQDFNPTSRITNKVGSGDPCTLSNQLAVLYDIFWIDDDRAWIVGEDGVLIQTVNGGLTWSDGSTAPFFERPLPLDCGPDPYDAYRIHFFEDSGPGFAPYSKGIIASEFGKLFTTEDSGASWLAETLVEGVYPPLVGNENLEFWGLEFEDPTDASSPGWLTGGVITGRGYVFRTSGGGAYGTWSQSYCYEGLSPQEWLASGECSVFTIYDVAVLGTGDPTATIVGYKASLFTREPGTANFDPTTCTVDASPPGCSPDGDTWVQQETFFETAPFCSDRPAFFGVARLSDTVACAVGHFGRIVLFTHGAQDPVVDVGTTHAERLYAGAFHDALEGFVAGQGYAIKRTTDSGVTWTDLGGWDCAGQDQINALAFSNDDLYGVAVGTKGFIAWTDTSGASWTQFTWSETANLNEVDFANSEATVFAVGNGGVVRKSTNNGQFWRGAQSPGGVNLHGVSFVDADTGYVAGAEKKVYITTTSGSSWASVGVGGTGTETIWDVETWGDASQAVAVGDNGKVWEKSGATFVEVTDAGLQALGVTDALYDVQVLVNGSDIDLRICGNNGVVLFRDGGTWSRKKSQTNNPLHHLSFVDATHGFAFGQNFVVVGYSP